MTTAVEMGWPDHQEWERSWWGDCSNTYGEETKQITYAHRMRLEIVPDMGRWPVYDLAGKSVLDLGGGPASMLLKTKGGGRMTVVDPCEYPRWVAERYATHAIEYRVTPAEDFHAPAWYDECWIYNVLQHVRDPLGVIDTARRHARTLRIFDWVETPASEGHPHTLHAAELDEWLGGQGFVEQMNENGCVGPAYYGVFAL